MKKMKRLLAIILASLLILSSATAGASAYQAYKDDALTKYDFTDTAVLTTEQYASALLDYADKALAKANITMDLSILGKLDATSIDNALSSVYKLINDNSGILWMAGDLNKVEVGMLEKRRRSNSSDVEVIKSLLEFLGHDSNRKIVRKVVLGGIGKQRRDDGVSLGVANSFVKVDLNVEVMLRELLWGLAYPNTAYNSSTTVDTMVQTIIQNALAGVPIIPESVRNLVDLNSTKSTYDFIEDLLQTAYNDIAVPMLNDQTMKWLGQEIDKDTTGTLAGLFNRDFRVSAYTVPAGSTLVGELNNIAGGIVNGLLKNYNGWVSGDNSKLTDNVVAVARYILKETGDYFFPDWQKHIATPEEIDAMSKEALIAYIARSVINASVGYMYIPEDVTTVVGVAWEAVKQLMAQFLPERDYSNYPKTIDGILDMLADYIAYNVNPGIDLNAGSPKEALNYGSGFESMLTTAVKWLAADPQFYTGLLPDTTVDTSNGWKALDDIFFKLLDKSILPAKFANSGSETILKDIVYSILNGLLVDQDLTCISDLFVKNESGVFASQTLKQSIVRLVTDILNAVLPGSVATKYYASLNDIVKNEALGKIVYDLLGCLRPNFTLGKDTFTGYGDKLVPPIVNIVAQVMKLVDKSKFGQMEFAGPTRVSPPEKGDVAYSVTIFNGSKGINRGYTDKNGNFTQDALYKYKIAGVSATAYTAAGAGSNVSVSGVSAGDIINGGDSKTVSVSKPGATDTTVVLTVGYFILTESGASLTGDTPLYASFYTYYSSDTQDDSEPKDISTITGKVRLVKPRAGFINQNETLDAINNVHVRINRVKDGGHLTKSTYTQNASTFKGNTGTFFENTGFSGETENENTNITESLWQAKSGADRAALTDGTYTIDYSVKATRTATIGGKTGTVTGSVSIYVYNDYEVPAKYKQYSGEQRQRANYSADADAEWAAYQSALIMAANYALRPKLKANFSNASYMAQYKVIADNLDAAAAALDKKVVSASVDSLKTAVEAVQGKENAANAVYWDDGYNYFGYDDFNSVTWNGWKEARNRALNLYNSTIAPVEPVAPEKPGDDATLIEKQKYEKAYAQWQTDHAAWETAIAAWQMPTISAIDVAYAEQQIELWGPRLIKLAAVKTHLDAAIAMCTIDSADASKYDADRWEAYAKSFAYAQKVSTSFNASTTMRTQVREAMNNLIYNWKRLIAAEVTTVTFTFTVNGEVHAVLTGNQGDPVDLSTIAAPDAPVGMHFVGWGNVPATFDADATFEAQFANNTDTKYTVNVYNMDTTGAYPSAPDSTYQGAGETGSTADITADAAPAEGFSLDSANSVLTGTIAADGSLVLSIYYSRNQYTVTYANTDLAPDTYYYGATVVARTPEKAGFNFDGWEEEVPSTMPAQNITLTAKWNENPADYTDYDIAVDAAKAKKAEANYDKTYTEASRKALDAALAVDVSNKKRSEQGVVDAQTAAINAAVKGLKLMTYNAEFYVDNELYRTVATEVGAQIVAPEAPPKVGYTFTGWNPEVGVMGVENVRFDAKFSAGEVSYTVETYVMGLDGQYGAADSKNVAATTGAEITLTPDAREGFTVAGESVLTGKVEADSSLVLKVYYSRNQYKLTVDGVESDVYFGAALEIADPAPREGYTFTGWSPAVPATMPAEDLTLVPQWSENGADYTAYNKAVSAAKAKQTESDYAARYTEESRNALAAALAADVSGKKYTQQGEVDAAATAINNAVAGLNKMTYNAIFTVDGAEYAKVPTKVDDQIVAPKDPSKEGYTFAGWRPSVGVMGTADATFEAVFTAAGNTAYTVNTYVMGTDGTYGEPTSDTLTGTTGSTATYAPEAREGFTVADESVLSGKVEADGSLVLKVYYSRNQYTLTAEGVAYTFYYGAAVSVVDPVKAHYTFAGWDPALPETMPAHDVTVVAKWTEDGADYTAYNAAKAEAEAKQKEENYDKKYTAETRAALAEALANDVAGKKYSEQSVVDAATKAINDAVAALKVMTYNAIFTVDGVQYEVVPTKVGEQIVAPKDPAKEGYVFKGWDKEVGKMGVEDITFTAQFEKASGIAYTVEVYTMDVNGNYGAAETKTLYGTTDATVNADTTAAEGFTFDESADNVVSGKIAADGSLVLKVYFARNQYKLTVDGAESMVYYGAAISVAEPTKAHETFNGWDPALPETMPAHDVTVVSTWIKDDADYTEYKAARAHAEGIVNDSEYPYEATYTAESRAALDAALAIVVPKGLKYDEQHIIDAAKKAIEDAVLGLELMRYKVTYLYDDGSVFAEFDGDKGGLVSYQVPVPSENPTKEGYVFTGWDHEIPENMPAHELTFTAQFSAGEVTYTVETYEMDVNGTYGAATVKTVPATTGEAVSVTPETREGFTVADNSVLSGTVEADSSLVLKVYYSRNQYKLSVDGVESDVYYGAALNIAAPAAREGFTFAGWNVEVPANMPAENLTLVSQWSENDADYSAYNAAVSAAQAKKGEENYDKKYTAETRAALAEALANDVAGKKYSEQSVVDAATKAINDAVAALKVMTYNAIFTVDGVQYEVVPTKVGEQIVAPKDPAKEGYVFKGWDKEVGKMGVEDITFTAQFEKASGIAYTVEVYTMDVNGNYGAAETKTLYGTTDATVNADTTAAEGFTFDESADNVVSGKIAADGSLVLKVYFARNQYKLTVDGAESMVYYGAAISVAEPTKAHETFNGWDPALPETMPAHDVTVVSTWIKDDADYSAYNEAKAKAEAKQNEENYDKKYTAETRNALAEALKTVVPEGLKYDEQHIINAATTAINDAVKALELETYTATFYVNGEVHATVTAKVGEQIAAPADPIVDGYNFTGWDPEVGTMGIENVRFDAILVASGSSIISVTPATPNYGGMHQYAVKVKGEPQKLRIVDAYGTTRTFDRNTSMTSDVNAFGILKIEKTEDGEIWTLNVNLVEGEYTALAKFDKAWEEDGYDFTVKFDTKPSEPVSDGVLDVTYNTPNYGGKQEYFVKVSGKADKIQIAYENGGTTTRARYDLRVSIKSYDAQGNEVDAKSANLAYEIWTVKLNIAEGKHVARAKYGKVWTGDHEFTVVYDVKPAPKGVVDVTYDTPNYGGKQQYSFKVDGKASKIQIAYGEGGTTTFIRIDPRVSIKSYDAQGNEVSANSADLAYEIWTVKLSIPEGKHLAKAKYGKTWTDGFEFDVVITSKPIKVVSVTAVSVSADSVAVTVNGTAKKVRITYASGATRTYDRDDIGVSIASNGDGEIWTINVKLTEGDYTATAKYMANGKQVWDTTDFAFTV